MTTDSHTLRQPLGDISSSDIGTFGSSTVDATTDSAPLNAPSSQIPPQNDRHRRTLRQKLSPFVLRRQTYMALAEALFVDGERVKAVPAHEVVDEMEEFAQQSKWIILGFNVIAWLVEIRTIFRMGRTLGHVEQVKRERILTQWSSGFMMAWILRGATMPLKILYCLREDVMNAADVTYGIETSTTVEAARWMANHIAAKDTDELEDLEAEFVVIGSGAGGAAAAYELACQGHAVVMIEEGNFFDRRDFNGKIVELSDKLYRYWGGTSALGSGAIPIPIGKTVGGTTTVNSGTCYPLPDAVRKQWYEDKKTDYGVDELTPYFEEVAEMLRVQPAERQYVGPLADVIEQGAKALGLHDTHILQRNAEGCDGQGLCQFGCPTDAKRSTNVSYVPAALSRGAMLISGMKVKEILFDGHRATGVRAVGEGLNGRRLNIKIKAPHVIVAAGSLLTPLLLKRAGVRNHNLGRNLSIHPATALLAHFPDVDFDHQRVIPQGYGVGDLSEAGIRFEGGTPPFVVHGMAQPLFGKDYAQTVERYRKMGYFGFMVTDKSRGRVRPGLLDDLPMITYKMSRRDWSRMRRGLEQTARMFLRAGAQEVHIAGCAKFPVLRTEADVDQMTHSKLRPSDIFISAYHPLGTARVGTTPDIGVCDPNHKVFGKQGLYVMDGSSLPSSLGVNPQMTIMAMATRAARKLGQSV